VDFPFPAGIWQPGALGNVGGPVFFAVASPGPGSTAYTYDVPRGQYVLLPLYTFDWVSQSKADFCSDYACGRRLADSWVRLARSLKADIDGEPVLQLRSHYEATPRFHHSVMPVDGWFAGGDPQFAGRWFGVSTGYWLMLRPLSPGKHVLTIEVTAPYSCANDDCGTTWNPGPPERAETTLILNVAGGRRDRDDDDDRDHGNAER
jgi:hypothetical protein